ncbi:MAG: tetratricopeptide repeat protein [Thermodesulfobacteriota bacterium]
MKDFRIMAAGLVVMGLLSGCATVTQHYQAWNEYRTGLALFKAEKYGEAREHVKAALDLLPDKSQFLALLGWTFYRQSRIEEARRLFLRVLESEHKGVAGPQGLAWVDYSLGRYDSSEEWFKKELDWATDHMEGPDWVYYGEADKRYVDSIRSDAAYGLGLIALARGRSKGS